MKVTDPNLLQQLNAQQPQGGANNKTLDVFAADADAPQPKKVTDPALLAHLNGGSEVASAKQQEPAPGLARTALDQGMQGATFGFADEIMNPLGALAASLATHPMDTLKGEVNDPDLAESIANVNNDSKSRLNAEMQQHPVVSIGSQVGGSLLTGAAGASTKAGAAIANSLRSGGVGARALKGAVAGAASGGLYGAGSADEGSRLEGAKNGAILGGGVGAAAPIVGAALSSAVKGTKNVAKGAVARSPEALQDALSTMQDKVTQSYSAMRAIGADLAPAASGKLINNIKSAIANQQFIPDLNPKTLAIVNHIDDRIAQAGTNGSITLNELDQYRRLLGKVGNSEDGVSAGLVKKAIDDTVNGLKASDLTKGTPDAIRLLNEGRKQAQQAFKFEAVSDILTRAEGDPNKIKAGLTKLINSKTGTRGFSIPEMMALKSAANSGNADKLARGLGTFGFDLGKAKNVALPALASGGALAVPAAVPLVVAGTAARQGRKLAARGSAEKLLQEIEKASSGIGKASAPAQSRLPSYINPSLLLGQAANAAAPLMRVP